MFSDKIKKHATLPGGTYCCYAFPGLQKAGILGRILNSLADIHSLDDDAISSANAGLNHAGLRPTTQTNQRGPQANEIVLDRSSQ